MVHASVDDFAEFLTDHLLSSGKDMYAHNVDIHEHVAYFLTKDLNLNAKDIEYVQCMCL